MAALLQGMPSMQPLHTLLWENLPMTTPWEPKRDMPDQTGRVAIVTGGNSGVGYYTTLELMRKGARVYMASRDPERAAKAIAQLRAVKDDDGNLLKGEVKLLRCDLSDLESVRSAVDEFTQQESQLHLVFANAGIMFPPYDQKTAQGYEMQFGTHVLGHHVLIRNLLPVLRKTAAIPGQPKGAVRVCLTSSAGHNMHQRKGFDKHDPEWAKPLGVIGIRLPEQYHQIFRYGHSKFCNILQSKKYDREFGNDGIVFTSVNPGNMKTGLQRHMHGLGMTALFLSIQPILYPIQKGCINQLYATTAPENANLGGAYFGPWAKLSRPAFKAHDEGAQDNLYEWLEDHSKGFV